MTVVEHKQKFAAILKALYGMGETGREIPQIAGVDVGNEIPPVLIDRGHARAAKQHIGPFGLLMPVQLADASRGERHIDSGQSRRNRQLAYGDLARPAAFVQLHMRVREGKAQVGDESIIRYWRDEQIRILHIQHDISRAIIRGALSVPYRLRDASRLLCTAIVRVQFDSPFVMRRSAKRSANDGIHKWICVLPIFYERELFQQLFFVFVPPRLDPFRVAHTCNRLEILSIQSGGAS
ncbi:hypothetical protein D3C71_1256900 [compost metagenome]